MDTVLKDLCMNHDIEVLIGMFIVLCILFVWDLVRRL